MNQLSCAKCVILLSPSCLKPERPVASGSGFVSFAPVLNTRLWPKNKGIKEDNTLFDLKKNTNTGFCIKSDLEHERGSEQANV